MSALADVGGAQLAWLVLYLGTFALHVALIAYVVGGSAYALVQAVRRADDPIAARALDLLPFMLGLGITAGVAPLLFLQLLYQERFYTANLLLGPRWGAVVPALIAGFYALYLAKATARVAVRRGALGLALGAFVFVAWSWTELHALMQADAAWRAMYAAGARLYADAGIAPRLVLWLGAMASGFATLAAWWVGGPDAPASRRRLAAIALAGRLVSAAAVGALAALDAPIVGAAPAAGLLLVGALVVEAAGWGALWRGGGRGALLVTSAAGAVALLAGTVVREAPRLALLAPPRAIAAEAGGAWVFVVTLVAGGAVLAWVARTVRRAGA